MSEAAGRFVWFDLMTTDIEGAKSFYSDIIGWKIATSPRGDYEILHAGEDQIGGVMRLPKEAQDAGAPPHWMGYVSTDDVDTTAKQAAELGGTILVPGTDIPNVGRFAVLADPQGAAFAIFQQGEKGGTPGSGRAGHIQWNELNTTDWESAWAFYSRLFGWKHTSTMDMGPEYGQYFMFDTKPEGDSMGGMSNMAGVMKHPPHWLHYISVHDVDELAKEITAKGGKVVNGPIDVPGGARIAQCMDPQGGLFAILSSGKE